VQLLVSLTDFTVNKKCMPLEFSKLVFHLQQAR